MSCCPLPTTMTSCKPSSMSNATINRWPATSPNPCRSVASLTTMRPERAGTVRRVPAAEVEALVGFKGGGNGTRAHFGSHQGHAKAFSTLLAFAQQNGEFEKEHQPMEYFRRIIVKSGDQVRTETYRHGGNGRTELVAEHVSRGDPPTLPVPDDQKI